MSGCRSSEASGAPLVRLLFVVGFAAATAACTTLPGAPLVRDEGGCHAWTAQLDMAVAGAGVGDAEAETIAGFPGLRIDRVGAALREEASSDDARFAAWLARAAALDRAARVAEIGNLPDSALPLGPAAGRPKALARTEACRESVLRQLLDPGPGHHAAATPSPATNPAHNLRRTLLARATVPDRYRTASRALGLYALVRWPFLAGVERWQDEHLAHMARWATAAPALQRFEPDVREAPDALEARGAATAAPSWPPVRDALGLPQPTAVQAQRLLAWHAPALDVEVRGDFDRFGVPQWGAGGLPQVDTRAPVVYRRIAHARLSGRWLLQLVYTLWFPERPARSSLDLLAGTLDGVVIRLTLDDDGQPILMDTMHACGCYHMFFPSSTLRARPNAPKNEEWLFAPAALPALSPAQRLAVRIASATHHVSGLEAAPRGAATGERPAGAPAYALRDEQALRSLPLPVAPGRRSLYGPDGLVAGSERGERFLFWPMGIASAGAMRQWGHHATAFVGRRHFDDPDLIEQRFAPARR